MKESTLPIHLPTVWSEQCSICVYKTPSPSSDLPERSGHSLSNVPRRYADSGENSPRAQSQLLSQQITADHAGLLSKRREILPGPNTGIRISGFLHRLQANDTISDGRETEVSNITMQEAVGCPTDHDSRTCSRNWSNDLNETSNPASPSPLQSPPRVEKHRSEPPPLIRYCNFSDTEFQAGSGVVDTPLETMEIAGYPTAETPTNTGIQSRLGSSVSQTEHLNRGCLGKAEDVTTHQLQRAPSSLVRPAMLCFESEKYTCTSQNRQYSSRSQDGGSPLQAPLQPGTGGVGLVPMPRSNNLSRTPTRFNEPTSRQGIQDNIRFLRMGSGHADLPESNGDQRSMHSGSFCLTPFSKATNILQLEIRPGSNSSECAHTALEDGEGVCLSTLLPDRQMSYQDQIRRDPVGPTDHAFMEITNLVSTPPRNVSGITSSSPQQQQTSHEPRRDVTPHGSTRPSSTSRLDSIRNSFQNRGLSERAITLLCASWRSNTESSYSSCWRVWEKWCIQKGVNPLCATILNVLEFLTSQFDQGKKYRTLNSYRSTISSTHMPVDGFQIGKHPLVS